MFEKCIRTGQRLFALGLVVGLAAGCNEPMTGEEPRLDVSLEGVPRFIEPGDTVSLSATVPRADLHLEWEASSGELIAGPTEALFIAPDGIDTTVLTLFAYDAGGALVASDTATVLVGEQIVVLKADDLYHNPTYIVDPRWPAFTRYIERKKIVAGLGLIAISLLEGAPEYRAWVRSLAANPRFEIWNHGYDHVIGATDSLGHSHSEFRNTSYEQQLAHLRAAEAVARDSLGVVMHTFGAPGNAIDSLTTRALAEVPDITVWLYGETGAGKFLLGRGPVAEPEVGHPSFEYFLGTYDEDLPVFTLELHPTSWSDESRVEFERIVDFLLARGVIFATPQEVRSYYMRVTDEAFAGVDGSDSHRASSAGRP